eukprot:scaffold2141_cov282-Pinguiococcus_pyrenoidosus.AAC.31
MRGESVRLPGARRRFESRCQIVNRRARPLCNSSRRPAKKEHQGLDQLGKLLLRYSSRVERAHLSDRPSRTVLHKRMLVRVLQLLDQKWRCPGDVLLQAWRRYPFHDGAKRDDRGFPLAPIMALDTSRDERHDEAHDIVHDRRRKKPKAGGAAHAQIPFILVWVLVLLQQAVRQQGNETIQSLLGIVHALPQILQRLPVLGSFPDVHENEAFLLADGRPKLDCLLRNLLRLPLDAAHCEICQDIHVRLEVLVVALRDLCDAFESNDSNFLVLALGGFTDDLHDHVPLNLLREVCACKLHGVPQCGRRRKSHLFWMLLKHRMDYHREHFVRGGLGQHTLIECQLFRHEAESLQGCDLDADGLLRGLHALLQLADEVPPFLIGNLNGTYLGGHLSTRSTCQVRIATQRRQRPDLDVLSHVHGDLRPGVELLLEQGRIVRRQGILNVKPSKLACWLRLAICGQDGHQLQQQLALREEITSHRQLPDTQTSLF